MGMINNTMVLPAEYENLEYGKQVLNNLRELTIGEKNDIIFMDKEGTRWGGQKFTTANAWIKNDGTYSFKDTSGSVVVDESGVHAGAITGGKSLYGWSSTITFHSEDLDTVRWDAGNIDLADGTSYAILENNTGNMSTLTYIYLDLDISETELQTTSTGADATGLNKILIATAKPSSNGANFQVFGGEGGVVIGTENLENDLIISSKIVDSAITNTKIANNAISTAKLQVDSVTSSIIADNAVDTAQLALDAVTSDIIEAGAVTSTEISDNAITTAKITASAITSGKIATDAITANKIEAGAITTVKISAGAVTANEIGALAVTTAKLNAGAVTTAKIDAGAVTANEISANAVTTAKIDAGAITTAKISAGAITSNEIASNTITAGDIASNTITANEITSNTITASELTTGAFVTSSANISNAVITNAHIHDLSADKINAGTITGINIISSSGDDSIRLTNGDLLEFYYDGSRAAYVRADASSDFHIVANDDVIFSAGGYDRCGVHGTAFRPEADDTYALGGASYQWSKVYTTTLDLGDWEISESTDQLIIRRSGTERFRLNDGKVRPAETYESSDGTDGLTDDVDLVSSVWESGDNLYYNWRTLTFKDGLLTNIGSNHEVKVCDNCVIEV